MSSFSNRSLDFTSPDNTNGPLAFSDLIDFLKANMAGVLRDKSKEDKALEIRRWVQHLCNRPQVSFIFVFGVEDSFMQRNWLTVLSIFTFSASVQSWRCSCYDNCF